MSQWSEVAWFGRFMVLKIDYDTEKLQKVTYDVIIWCHKDYVTEIKLLKWRYKNFSIFKPLP